MKPMFTTHGGEYLVVAHTERHFKRVKCVGSPRKAGNDLLVSDRQDSHLLTLHVKFSKDYLFTPHMKSEFHQLLRACGWWSINEDKLRRSLADFWVFVLVGSARRTTDFVIVPTNELQQRLASIHGSQRVIHSYLWVTNRDRCWETRGLRRADQLQVANGNYRHATRDFSKLLNEWAPVTRLNV